MRIGIGLLACWLAAVVAWGGEEAAATSAPLKVLMVGNSFSQSVRAYLPALAKAEAPGALLLADATIGGCSLERHCREMDASEADSAHKPYSTGYKTKDFKGGKVNLREMLTLEAWDIVTIQQASPESWRPEKFEPHAGRLVEYIRQLAPTAEIVIQQTWSYRADDGRIGGAEPSWGFDQDGMYERLTRNYRDLAQRYGARVIPTGLAVRLSRENSPPAERFRPYDPASLAKYRWPDLPSQAGDVVGAMWWSKNKETGKLFISRDTIHLNDRGKYLQACVWFGFLFPGRSEPIAFVPDRIDNADAEFLRACAREALTTADTVFPAPNE